MGLFKRSGGGFLNNVNGVIEGYKFGEKTWGEGDDAYRTLDVELLVRQDGAEEAVQQFLPAGFLYEGQEVSEDGLTVEGADGPVVREDSEFARFVQTLIEQGFPEDRFDGTGCNFEPMVGTRVTFQKEMNKERQLAAGRKKLGKAKAASATEEQLLEAGRRQDKNDKKKFYNHDRLIVGALLALPEENDAKPAKGGAKAKSAAKATTAKPAAKPAAAKTKAGASDMTTQADEVLTGILADAKDNTVQRGSISSLIVRYALANGIDKDARESLRKFIYDEAYLNEAVERGLISYDSEDKKQPISLA